MKYEKINSEFIWKKPYLKRFIAGMVGYGLMLPITITGKKMTVNEPLLILLAILPMIPFVFALLAYSSNFKTMDEMWKKIHAQALLITAMVTIATSLGFGLLQIVGVMKLFSVFFLFPFMLFVWGICFVYLAKRDKIL